MFCSAIGAPAARLHNLRHSYAALSLQIGDDIKTLQSNLGHHTAAFTLDVHGHITGRMKQASASRQDAYIQSLRGHSEAKRENERENQAE